MTGRSTTGTSTPEPALELDLAFLMLWLSGCAVYFALARHFLTGGPQSTAELCLMSIVAGLTAAGWAGMLVVSVRLVSASRVRIPPGAWMLYSLGIVQTADLASGVLPAESSVSAHAVRIGVNMLAFALPTLNRRLRSTWKWGFVALVVVQPLPLMNELIAFRIGKQWVHVVRILVAALIVGVAAAERRQLRQRQGWLHWLGTTCVTAWLLLLTLAELGQR